MPFRQDRGGVWGVVGTGGVSLDPAAGGQVSFALDGATHLAANANWHPTALPATIFAVIYRASSTVATGRFHTGETAGAYRGLAMAIQNTGELNVRFGDGGGATGADRRSAISSFVQAAGTVSTWSVTITGATTFAVWKDGRKDPSLSLSGTGGGMNTAGGGVAEMARWIAFAATTDTLGGHLMIGVIDKSWADDKHAAFHENPWQVLRPYRRPIYFNAPAGFKAAWARNRNVIVSPGGVR